MKNEEELHFIFAKRIKFLINLKKFARNRRFFAFIYYGILIS
jgi:hypothetical protein